MKKNHLSLIGATFSVITSLGILASCAPYPQGTNPLSLLYPNQTAPGTVANTTAPQVTTPKAPTISKTPVGVRPANGAANLIISPYKPFNLIDVTGYKSGDTVGDPSTAQLDPATQKPIMSTSKHFLIP